MKQQNENNGRSSWVVRRNCVVFWRTTRVSFKPFINHFRPNLLVYRSRGLTSRCFIAQPRPASVVTCCCSRWPRFTVTIDIRVTSVLRRYRGIDVTDVSVAWRPEHVNYRCIDGRPWHATSYCVLSFSDAAVMGLGMGVTRWSDGSAGESLFLRTHD